MNDPFRSTRTVMDEIVDLPFLKLVGGIALIGDRRKASGAGRRE